MLVRLAGWLTLVWVVMALPTRAEDPPKEDPLPPPRVVPQPAGPVHVLTPPAFVRPDRYAVWQYYGVDRRGRFRPLVIGSPHGPYYLSTGKSYPYALLHSMNWLPYIAH